MFYLLGVPATCKVLSLSFNNLWSFSRNLPSVKVIPLEKKHGPSKLLVYPLPAKKRKICPKRTLPFGASVHGTMQAGVVNFDAMLCRDKLHLQNLSVDVGNEQKLLNTKHNTIFLVQVCSFHGKLKPSSDDGLGYLFGVEPGIFLSRHLMSSYQRAKVV